MTVDITAKIGELFPIHTAERPPEWPMYSFDRPSRILWNAIARRLIDAGWTEDQIKEWLQSRMTRWALDFSLGEAIARIGAEYAESMLKSGDGSAQLNQDRMP